MKQTQEGEGFPGVGDSIREDQRVPPLKNLFHQVPHSALEEFPLCCLRTVHLKRMRVRVRMRSVSGMNQNVLYSNFQKKKRKKKD